MTTKMHKLIHEVDAGGRTHKQPSDVGRQQEIPEHRSGYGDQDKYDQRVGREERYAPVCLVTKTHFLVGKELVMIECVAVVDRAEPFPFQRPVHDKTVQVPLENIARDANYWDGQPFPPQHIVNVLDVDPHCRNTNNVDHGNVNKTVVPTGDSGSVVLAKRFLLLA